MSYKRKLHVDWKEFAMIAVEDILLTNPGTRASLAPVARMSENTFRNWESKVYRKAGVKNRIGLLVKEIHSLRKRVDDLEREQL